MHGHLKFWSLVALLLLAAAGFARGAVLRKASIAKPAITVETGAIVHLVKTIDGDTLLVRYNEDTVALRMIGIKCFDPDGTRDPFAGWGQQATHLLVERLREKPLRVMAHNPGKDKHGRALATLFLDGDDVGLDLVRRGLAMVFTAYPFPSMSRYLQEQEAARAERRGFWADAAATKRADLLAAEWREESP
jgi:endonuclease YncB( thermonuclease family)